MTSTTPRIITIILATLALTAPVAGAMPTRDTEGVQTSSLAGTTSGAGHQDLRNPDQQAPAPKARQDLRNPDQQAPAPKAHRDLPSPDNRVPGVPSDLPQTMKPVHLTPATPATPVADDGPSPFVFIIPGLALIAMLGAAATYTRTSRPARV